MKRWRRSGGGRVAVSLPPGPVLTPLAGEVVEAAGVASYVGTHFLLWQNSPTGADPWAVWSEQPIDADPQPEAFGGFAGEFARAAVTLGDSIPVTQWSNVVQIPG